MNNKVDVLKSKEENIKKLEEDFILNTEYTNVLEPITTTCKVCGHTSTKTARTFLRTGCQHCKKIERKEINKAKIKQEDEEYLEKVNLENNNEYRIIKYRRGKDDSITLEHIPCGTKTKIFNRNVKVVCNKCNPEKLIDADWYVEKYKQIVADGYEVMDVIYGDYTETRSRPTNILVKHLECGNEYTRNSSTLKLPDGHLCPFCVEKKRIRNLDDDDIDYKVKDALGDEYEYAGGYINSKEQFDIRHIPCGNTYKTRLSTLYKGIGKCRKCYTRDK